MNEETDFSTFIKNRITELRCQKGISEYTLSLAQHHKLKKKMERNLFAGSFHCVKI